MKTYTQTEMIEESVSLKTLYNFSYELIQQILYHISGSDHAIFLNGFEARSLAKALNDTNIKFFYYDKREQLGVIIPQDQSARFIEELHSYWLGYADFDNPRYSDSYLYYDSPEAEFRACLLKHF